MKNKILAIILFTAMAFYLVGCSDTTVTNANTEESNNISMFVVVESTTKWDVVYHCETKVMYVVTNGSHCQFTVLLDSDGSPLLYEE